MDILDTSKARSAILARIRELQQRGPHAKAEEVAEASAVIAAKRRGPVPDLGMSALEFFLARAEELDSTVAKVGHRADVPAEVLRYLNSLQLATQIAAWDSLADLSWPGLDVQFRACQDSDQVGLSETFCAVAEAGSIVMASGPTAHSSTHIYPATHIAVVRASRICAHYEDAFDLLRQELGELPRSVNIVSGPSRTGDIEQTIVLGAHGPYRLHIILLEQE